MTLTTYHTSPYTAHKHQTGPVGQTLIRPRLLPVAGALLLAFLATSASAASVMTAAPAGPKFYAPGLVTAGKTWELPLTPNQPEVKNWRIHWGDDSSDSIAAADIGSLTHQYNAPGAYTLSVSAIAEDGTITPATLDYGRMIEDNHPLSYFPLDGLQTLPTPDLARPVDQFGAEFWIQPDNIYARQDIITSSAANGSQLYIANGNLNLELPTAAIFSQALPNSVLDGAAHHISVTYDRVPLYPYQNVARFYLDGVLLGQLHLDRYDTGPIAFPDYVIGNAALNQTNPFNYRVRDLALYDHLLAPRRMLDQIAARQHPQSTSVLAVAATVTPFSVDLPRITQTVDVLLDSSATVDNGPALRAAIKNATAGTRLRILDKDTLEPGQSFHVNTLEAGGNDWTAFRVYNKRDLEIDGGGATFIFGVQTTQFWVKGSQRVALKNFAIDLDQTKFRVGAYARILDIDEASGAVRFQFINARTGLPDETIPTTMSLWRWRAHDPKTLRIASSWNSPVASSDAFVASPTRAANDRTILVGQLKPSQISKFYSNRQNLFVVNNSTFKNISLKVDTSQHLTIDHVNFYATMGMTVLSGSEDHVAVTNSKIGLPPGLTAADRPYASGADGFHFHSTQGSILFADNEIAMTDDDALSIKDPVIRNISVAAENALNINSDSIAVGDELQFYNWDFSPINYRARIVALNNNVAQMDQPVPSGLGSTFLATNRRYHTEDYIVQRNNFHDYNGRLLLTTPHAVVSDNLFSHTYVHFGASNADFDNAGITSFVSFYNNLLIDANVDVAIWGSSSTYKVFDSMNFYQNSFVGKNLVVNNTRNANILGNYFELRTPTVASTSAIKLTSGQNIVVQGNVEMVPKAAVFDLSTNAPSEVQSTGNVTRVTPALSTSQY